LKLSEAMPQGVSRYKLDPNALIRENGGCLLGVAALADGVVCEDDDVEPILEHWPWIADVFPVPDICEGTEYSPTGLQCGGPYIAAEILSNLAFQVKEGWTPLEEVLEWIRSVEPESL
jgi:hypothetical protein